MEDGDRDLTIPGTSKYPVPKILLNDRKPFPEVDRWGLGIILYEMLIGIPPFYSKDDK